MGRHELFPGFEPDETGRRWRRTSRRQVPFEERLRIREREENRQDEPGSDFDLPLDEFPSEELPERGRQRELERARDPEPPAFRRPPTSRPWRDAAPIIVALVAVAAWMVFTFTAAKRELAEPPTSGVASAPAITPDAVPPAPATATSTPSLSARTAPPATPTPTPRPTSTPATPAAADPQARASTVPPASRGSPTAAAIQPPAIPAPTRPPVPAPSPSAPRKPAPTPTPIVTPSPKVTSVPTPTPTPTGTPTPTPPPIPTATPTPTPTVTPTPTATPTPRVTPTPTATPTPTPSATPPAASVSSANAAAAASSSGALAADRAAVQGVLERYRQAFNSLNATGIEAFWPSVNRRALDRAFAQLESQMFRFDSCAIDVDGATATASCAGRAQFTPKVGNRLVQEESRRWMFRLRQASGRWFIESVNSR